MLILRSVNDPTGERIYFLNKPNITIGRVGCDISLRDGSVSRNQAQLFVSPLQQSDISNLSIQPTVSIVDVSRFGTRVNGVTIKKNEPVQLAVGSTLLFAAHKVSFVLEYFPLVFCFSSVPRSEVASLTEKIALLGHISPIWTKKCTHLVMTRASFTEKLGLALIDARPIIYPNFIISLSSIPVEPPVSTSATDSVQNQMPSLSHEVLQGMSEQVFQAAYSRLPRVIDFLPEVDETIHSTSAAIYPDPRRSTLFAGMRFLFLEKNIYNTFIGIVVAAGGVGEVLPDVFLQMGRELKGGSVLTGGAKKSGKGLTTAAQSISTQARTLSNGTEDIATSSTASLSGVTSLTAATAPTTTSLLASFRKSYGSHIIIHTRQIAGTETGMHQEKEDEEESDEKLLVSAIEEMGIPVYESFEIPGALLDVGFQRYLAGRWREEKREVEKAKEELDTLESKMDRLEEKFDLDANDQRTEKRLSRGLETHRETSDEQLNGLSRLSSEGSDNEKDEKMIQSEQQSSKLPTITAKPIQSSDSTSSFLSALHTPLFTLPTVKLKETKNKQGQNTTQLPGASSSSTSSAFQSSITSTFLSSQLHRSILPTGMTQGKTLVELMQRPLSHSPDAIGDALGGRTESNEEEDDEIDGLKKLREKAMAVVGEVTEEEEDGTRKYRTRLRDRSASSEQQEKRKSRSRSRGKSMDEWEDGSEFDEKPDDNSKGMNMEESGEAMDQKVGNKEYSENGAGEDNSVASSSQDSKAKKIVLQTKLKGKTANLMDEEEEDAKDKDYVEPSVESANNESSDSSDDYSSEDIDEGEIHFPEEEDEGTAIGNASKRVTRKNSLLSTRNLMKLSSGPVSSSSGSGHHSFLSSSLPSSLSAAIPPMTENSQRSHRSRHHRSSGASGSGQHRSKGKHEIETKQTIAFFSIKERMCQPITRAGLNYDSQSARNTSTAPSSNANGMVNNSQSSQASGVAGLSSNSSISEDPYASYSGKRFRKVLPQPPPSPFSSSSQLKQPQSSSFTSSLNSQRSLSPSPQNSVSPSLQSSSPQNYAKSSIPSSLSPSLSSSPSASFSSPRIAFVKEVAHIDIEAVVKKALRRQDAEEFLRDVAEIKRPEDDQKEQLNEQEGKGDGNESEANEQEYSGTDSFPSERAISRSKRKHFQAYATHSSAQNNLKQMVFSANRMNSFDTSSSPSSSGWMLKRGGDENTLFDDEYEQFGSNKERNNVKATSAQYKIISQNDREDDEYNDENDPFWESSKQKSSYSRDGKRFRSS
ncbi:Nijmegen breakage syndrome protein 1 [Monocercomonoides exilis]|uniref:Nijmegen breakage syndrome protein 1 n=1 Tax=Monocercomonoides exilis TaxID=2049356 RepID=UPI00355A7377|nr:Nijmegen breakage syndrome protein 1 [Monocercomonoides exilis]|eukprot:MONOS_1786.1-p1 / transcript=MONOS_1786.1 / gene=MONOS_1786 / organism=Monocercomonoides_exilis_PA203 / gene_product=Nijmegen breakage syndrome protein 1 / transcript_product=Nijmegen breakage syndrome protein 1 / location=Mono_scaffold00033:130948-134789(-) / protein_length=1265 / sequence_SO=supercontig / SO=protein_coding / is_pseudo=false